MTTSLMLAGYALVGLVLGAAVLRRAAWVDRAPGLAIGAWQALSASLVLAVAFAGLALAVPSQHVSAGLAGLARACAMALRHAYDTPGGAPLAWVGALVAVGVPGWCGYCLARELARAAARRRRHHGALAVLGRREDGWTLLDHPRPAAYCLAGRPCRVVLTTAAHAALDDAQRAAVLAHERAHLRGRHHLAVGAAAALAAALPGVRFFQTAHREIIRLVELVADDAAVRSGHRLALAAAMLTLGAGHPVGTLAAVGSPEGAADRVRRLIAGSRPLGRVRSWLGVLAAVAVLALPVALVTQPALSARGACCPRPAAACPLPGGHPECAGS